MLKSTMIYWNRVTKKLKGNETGVILGGLVAGILLLLKIKKRKEAIPFGPFLSLATIATLFWGSDILNWYLGLF